MSDWYKDDIDSLDDLRYHHEKYDRYRPLCWSLKYTPLPKGGCEITGKSYPLRKAIRLHLNGRWNKSKNSWSVDMPVDAVRTLLRPEAKIVPDTLLAEWKALLPTRIPYLGYISTFGVEGMYENSDGLDNISLGDYNKEHAELFVPVLAAIAAAGYRVYFHVNYD